MSYSSEAGEATTRRGKILSCVWRLVDGLLCDDHEEADGLAPDDIGTAITAGELSVEDVVACFREALVEGLDADDAECIGEEAGPLAGLAPLPSEDSLLRYPGRAPAEGCLLIYRGEE